MGTIDDLPSRGESHVIQTRAESAFRKAVEDLDFFVVQGVDQNDYGSDYQIETIENGQATNSRVHVQVKGTAKDPNTNGSVSIAVARTNLNYLLLQPDSIYICFHVPSNRLLVTYATSVLEGYFHAGTDWEHQKTITVRFTETFDFKFQNSLKARIIARDRSQRDDRIKWSMTPPDQIARATSLHIPLIEVPPSIEAARKLLTHLYNEGRDELISRAFEGFIAVVSFEDPILDLAYLAEVNLAMSGLEFNTSRVESSIERLELRRKSPDFHLGATLYSLANAHFALGRLEEAHQYFLTSLIVFDQDRDPTTEAMCSKNFGSLFEKKGEHDTAKEFYKRALDLNPNLDQAHLALAIWHLRRAQNPGEALKHLDAISFQDEGNLGNVIVQGWRVQSLFLLDRPEEAFREISSLRSQRTAHDWIQPWCENQVAIFGRNTESALRPALRFWRSLDPSLNCAVAQHEAFFIQSRLRFEGEVSGIDFAQFACQAEALVDAGNPDSALIWDRVGHWAQLDGDWATAASFYRKAHDLNAEQFAYCLGTSLVFLNNGDHALPILEAHVGTPVADDMSWFQLAVARQSTGDASGAIFAYEFAISLNPNYALAWFNLGGAFWNAGERTKAVLLWRQALDKFPDHELADTARRMMNSL